jgi:hypothetical protein
MSAGKPDEHLEKVITVRVSKRFFDGLEEKRKKTNCQTVSEMVRAILYKERIMFYYTDASLNATAIELAGIRKELNQIAGNVSDITQSFHSADSESQRMFQALRVAEEYKRVESKVEKLQIMVSEIGKKWLQG